MEEVTFNSCIKMNKPIRFFGLSSFQVIVLFVCVTTSILFLMMTGLNLMIILIIFGGECYGISVFATKLNRAHKKGTPDYFGAYSTFQYTPRKITDQNFLFSFLIKNKIEHGN